MFGENDAFISVNVVKLNEVNAKETRTFWQGRVTIGLWANHFAYVAQGKPLYAVVLKGSSSSMSKVRGLIVLL